MTSHIQLCNENETEENEIHLSYVESEPMIDKNKNICIKLLSSLLENGCDQDLQDLSTSLNFSTLLLSLLQDNFSTRKPCLIKLLVSNGYGASMISCKARCSIHRSIAMKEFSILNSLMSSGEFAPSVMNFTSSFCLIPNSYDDRRSECCLNKVLLKRFGKLLSPFCMALLCGHVRTAKNLVAANFLITTDYNSLPADMSIKEELKARKLNQSLSYLKELSSTPLKLFSLSFVCVSELIGSSAGRQNRIMNLCIPPAIKRALLFQCSDQVIGNDDDDISPQRCLDNDLLWRNQIDKLRFLWSLRPSTVFNQESLL